MTDEMTREELIQEARRMTVWPTWSGCYEISMRQSIQMGEAILRELKASERDREVADTRLATARRYVELLVYRQDEDWTEAAKKYLEKWGLPDD